MEKCISEKQAIIPCITLILKSQSSDFIMQQRTDSDSDCLIYHNIKILHITKCIQFREHFLFLISIIGDTSLNILIIS